MENYKRAIKNDKYTMNSGISRKKYQSQNEANSHFIINNSIPIMPKMYLNTKNIIISGCLENRNENKYIANNVNDNRKILKKEENHREKQEMHRDIKRPQSYKYSQNNSYNPNIIHNNNNRISIDSKEIQKNKNIPNNYQRNKNMNNIYYSNAPQIIKTNNLPNQVQSLLQISQLNNFNNKNVQKNYRKPEEMYRSLLNKPENKTNLQQHLKGKNPNKGAYNRIDLEEVSLQTPSKEESQSKMNLMKGTESSNKIESSNKKGKTSNNFSKKKNLVKKQLDLNLKPNINKEEKNKENLNENLFLRTKPLWDKSKNSKEIQNDSAEKKIMESNIINNKYESEIESLRKENLELKNQINENKISISIKENHKNERFRN